MTETQDATRIEDVADRLVDPHGRPARKSREDADRCPRCRAGKDKRVPSAGFGEPHPVCGTCGHDFHGERWDG